MKIKNMMNNNNMNCNNCPTRELLFFSACLEHNYKLNSKNYPMISKNDIEQFKERMKYFIYRSVGLIGCHMLYDPIMEPLVQSSLAHFLYMKNNPFILEEYESLPEMMPFQPLNYRLRLMDGLIRKNTSVTLDCIKLVEFTLITRKMDIENLIHKINDLLINEILRELVYSFIDKIKLDDLEIVDDFQIGYYREQIRQVEVDPKDRLLGILPTRECGLIYSILMDFYLEVNLDSFINDQIKKYKLNRFWFRCMNTAIFGIYEKDKFPNHIDLDGFLLPAGYIAECGLTAKERASTRGGRVLRPFRGKLYLDIDGYLQWEPPEC